MLLIMQIMNFLRDQGFSIQDIQEYFEVLSSKADPFKTLDEDFVVDLSIAQKNRIKKVLESNKWRSALKLVELDQESM